MHLRGHHEGFPPCVGVVWFTAPELLRFVTRACGRDPRTRSERLCPSFHLRDERLWGLGVGLTPPSPPGSTNFPSQRSMLRTTLVALLTAPAAAFVTPGRTLAASRAARSTSVRLGEFMEEVGVVGGGSLVGTTYALEMDIGQEKGSWMPPAWARSGARARPTATIAFREGGLLEVKETGYFDGPMIKFEAEGSWNEKGGRVQFRLPHGGLARNDVTLDAGELCFSAACWGPQLARRGGLTIKQRKMGFLPFLPTLTPASFMVGTFTAKPAAEAGAKAAPAPA